MIAKRKKKKPVLIVIAVVLVVAIGAGIWFAAQKGAEPVNVYPFYYLGMTEYWGDSRESYGPVTTDKIQTVFLTDTQTVTEIFVAQGDMVQKGDVLMSFDTTLSDLALERKRLEVEKLKLQLEDAQQRLWEIRNMKPMVIPQFTGTDNDSGDSNLGTALTDAYRLSTQTAYDGSSQEKALICWLNSAAAIDDSLLETIRQKAEEFQNANAQAVPSAASAVPEEISEDPPENPDETPEDPDDTPEDPDDTPEDPDDTPEDPDDTPEDPDDTPEDPDDTPEDPDDTPEDPDDTPEDPDDTPEDPDKPIEPPAYITVSHYYVVFKITQGNMSLGGREVWQGAHVYSDGSGGFSMKLFNANAIADHTLVQQDDYEEEQMPQIDFGSGYTAAQIAQMRSEQEKKIRELEFNIKMAEAEYKIMLTEVNDGKVYAQIDGEVVSVLTPEEAKQANQPILKVSGGGGFYVEGSISELEKDDLQPGQEVTVNDWNTGMTYTGEVISVGDFPKGDNGWNGTGNPNVSYYPFRVFVDGSADLQAGSYVSVMYSASSGGNGIYLENPFIRTEQGKSYIYVLGANGKLEKRFVTVGKSLWGSYKEILSGLTEDDLIAFPYGKNVKEGAPAVEADISSLYSY